MRILSVFFVFALFGSMSYGTNSVLGQTGVVNQGESATSGETAGVTHGEVRKIDKETGKITIRHDKIANLNMPPMTMVFKVVDKKMLNDLRVGDKVEFKAISNNGTLTITDIKAAK